MCVGVYNDTVSLDLLCKTRHRHRALVSAHAVDNILIYKLQCNASVHA